MKKLTLIITALAVVSLASCKKAYDCTCESKVTSETYASLMDEFDTFVEDANEEIDETVVETVTTTVGSLDKTSKATANAACATSSETTDYYEEADNDDADADDDYYESAYSVTTVSTTTCTLEKK